mgnify:CR=1 FL=1
MTPFQVKPELAEKIAAKGFPEGGTLRCPACKSERHATLKEIATFMTEGLPVCKKDQVKVQLIDDLNPWARSFMD